MLAPPRRVTTPPRGHAPQLEKHCLRLISRSWRPCQDCRQCLKMYGLNLLNWSLLDRTGSSWDCTGLLEDREPTSLVRSPQFHRLYWLDLPGWIWSGLSWTGPGTFGCNMFIVFFCPSVSFSCLLFRRGERRQHSLVANSVKRPPFPISIFLQRRRNTSRIF
ncbi:hypothetical protein TNCV_3528121 [Trichonephila clavipes]|nr:hypothetical protein TNCV_3528121 [Trichonephila clavipes]